MDFKRSENEPM